MFAPHSLAHLLITKSTNQQIGKLTNWQIDKSIYYGNTQRTPISIHQSIPFHPCRLALRTPKTTSRNANHRTRQRRQGNPHLPTNDRRPVRKICPRHRRTPTSPPTHQRTRKHHRKPPQKTQLATLCTAPSSS